MTDTAEETAQALTARQQMEEVWGDRKREKKGEDLDKIEWLGG